MKLNDLDKKDVAKKALKENFGINFTTTNLNKPATRAMLTQVRGLINEAKSSPNFYRNQTQSTYMKLVFMEQALVNHWAYLNTSRPRIVFENEEVEKSQVILAAQDMVDSLQKMIEQVNDMLVKELPALVDSIENDIGVNESQQYAQQATAALQALNQALPQAKEQMKGALGALTGAGGMDMAALGGAPGAVPRAAPEGLPAAGGEMPPAGEMPPEGGEAPPEGEMPAEEPEEPEAQVGRAKR